VQNDVGNKLKLFFFKFNWDEERRKNAAMIGPVALFCIKVSIYRRQVRAALRCVARPKPILFYNYLLAHTLIL
jgi:hypothetical protein